MVSNGGIMHDNAQDIQVWWVLAVLFGIATTLSLIWYANNPNPGMETVLVIAAGGFILFSLLIVIRAQERFNVQDLSSWFAFFTCSILLVGKILLVAAGEAHFDLWDLAKLVVIFVALRFLWIGPRR
jgi:hypothetical protein